MRDNKPVMQDDKRSGNFLLAGKLTASVATVGIALPSLVAFPEAVERHPFGGSITAVLIVAWLLHNVYLAKVGSRQRN